MAMMGRTVSCLLSSVMFWTALSVPGGQDADDLPACGHPECYPTFCQVFNDPDNVHDKLKMLSNEHKIQIISFLISVRKYRDKLKRYPIQNLENILYEILRQSVDANSISAYIRQQNIGNDKVTKILWYTIDLPGVRLSIIDNPTAEQLIILDIDLDN